MGTMQMGDEIVISWKCKLLPNKDVQTIEISVIPEKSMFSNLTSVCCVVCFYTLQNDSRHSTVACCQYMR